MALQLPTYTTTSGIALTNVYAWISKLYEVQYKHSQVVVKMTITIHKDQAAKEANLAPIGFVQLGNDPRTPLTFTGDQTRAQLYAYLHTLPQFAGATDV